VLRRRSALAMLERWESGCAARACSGNFPGETIYYESFECIAALSDLHLHGGTSSRAGTVPVPMGDSPSARSCNGVLIACRHSLSFWPSHCLAPAFALIWAHRQSVRMIMVRLYKIGFIARIVSRIEFCRIPEPTQRAGYLRQLIS
jgi:hypothetical protein